MAFGVSPEEEAAAAAAFEEEERKRRASAPPSPILGELTAAASEPVTLTGLRQASMGGPPAVAESPKPPPAPNGPTVTSRAGGMSVDVPVPAGQDVVQTTGTGGKSRSYVEPTKEEAKLREERDKEDQNAIEAQEKRNAHAVQVAEDARIAAEQKAAILAKAEEDQKKELEAYNAEVARREQDARQETDNHAKALADWQGARQTFWARKDTADKVGAGLSLILGVFGGVNDGRNVGAERIEKAIEADSDQYKQVLEQRKQILERSRGDVKEAKADIDRRIKMLDLRTAAALDRAAAEAEARGKRLGLDEAALTSNEGILKLRQGALDRRQKYQEGLRSTVKNEQAWSKVTVTGGTGAGGLPGGGEKPLEKWSGDEKKAEGFAQRMESAYAQMQQNNYSREDMEVIQNGALQESLLPQKASAIVDRYRGTVYKRLSPEGKKRFLAEQEFARANLRRESGAAISLKEQMDEIEGVGERPGETPDTRAQKQANARGKIAATGFSSGRPLYWQNRANELAAGGGAPAGGGVPAGIPSGAVMGTYKGKRGYRFGNQFYPME